jgi:DNA-binding NtrC family response regulator
MKISISEAARRAGVRRQTIYRKLEAGRLSKETGEDGNPVIDLAELARLYPYAVTAPGHKPETPRTGEKETEAAALRELVSVLKQDKERLTAELERARLDARADIERERGERERLLAMLEIAQRQLADLREKPKEDVPASPRRRGWLARLVGA